MDHSFEPVFGFGMNQYVHVIGHHAPHHQVISRAVKGEKRRLNPLGDLRVRQMAISMAPVERVLRNTTAFIRRPFGDVRANSRRQAVYQPEDDVLDEVRRLNMGEIAARAPCYSLGCERHARGPILVRPPHRR